MQDGVPMQTLQDGLGGPSQEDKLRQKIRIAELASEDLRLTQETRDRNKRAAEMGRLALNLLVGK